MHPGHAAPAGQGAGLVGPGLGLPAPADPGPGPDRRLGPGCQPRHAARLADRAPRPARGGAGLAAGDDPALHALVAAAGQGHAQPALAQRAAGRGQRADDQPRGRRPWRQPGRDRPRHCSGPGDRPMVGRPACGHAPRPHSPHPAPPGQHLRARAVLTPAAAPPRAALPVARGHPVDPHPRPPALGRGRRADRHPSRAAEPERGRQLAAARRRAGPGRARGRQGGQARDRGRRPQRRRLVAHQSPVPTAERPDRPAHRSRLLQQLPRPALVAALAARPRVLQPGFPPARPPAPARLRLGPLSDPDRPRIPSARGRPAGGRRRRARRPSRGTGNLGRGGGPRAAGRRPVRCG